MNTRLQRQLALVAVFCLCLPLSVRAQSFTNSATLSAALDGTGTNLVVSYSLANTQGWVTLFQAGSLTDLATNAQPFDLAPASATGQGQFTVPVNPAAPSQFYRLLIEQWPSRGKALVFTNGSLDFATMRATYGDLTTNTPLIYFQPIPVWLDHLGIYDTNGVLVGGNNGLLTGKYFETHTYAINNPGNGFPPLVDWTSTNNDFRVNYLGDTNYPARGAVIYSSEVQLYFTITDFRNRFLTDSFIDELNMPPALAVNFKKLQYRPDLNMGSPPTLYKPVFYAEESGSSGTAEFFPIQNNANVYCRTRNSFDAALPPISSAYDPCASLHEYAGLSAFWIMGTNGGFPTPAFWGGTSQWQTDVLPPFNDNISNWAAYRYTGNPELYRNSFYMLRLWDNRPFGGTWIPGDKGECISNVMMFDEQNTTFDGVFPFRPAATVTDPADGPTGSELASMYISAVFFDIANEAGLGLHKTDLLLWKTTSLISNNVYFPMRSLGATIQQAARQLWPDPRPGRAGLSLYEDDINDVMTSRGIPMNGVSDFRMNLPPAIWTNSPVLQNSSHIERGFGTGHPMIQPSVNFYGSWSGNYNGYTFTNPGVQYVAYQFYKHSKIGPADVIGITDGTFNSTTGNWNGDGTYYTELPGRTSGNLVVLAPGPTIRWVWKGVRATNEASGFYAEDVQPFGFMVTQATINGFSFTVTNLSATCSNRTYSLSIVDPSLVTLGAAGYAWSFTNYDGSFQTATGTNVQYTALLDQPFTLSIARTRATQTDTLTLRERGNDLDRNGGNAFVKNFVQ